jgi:hypothetical protein
VADDDQPELFPEIPLNAFGGRTYDPEKDYQRLASQLRQVRTIMLDGRKHYLTELAKVIASASGIGTGLSARVRDLRKPKFGGFEIESGRDPGKPGRWWYRMKLDDSGKPVRRTH